MKALIVVDVQNDFVPGGSLPVAEGDQVVPVINKLLKMPFDLKVATQDWHPKDHSSFATTHGKKPGEKILLDGVEQILWPVHCVQHSKGADFVRGLDTKAFQKIIYKGTDRNIDSYSCFFDNLHKRETGLAAFLKEHQITDVYIVGLATDYCVKYSALDALALGFTTHIITDGCRGVNLQKDDSKNALAELHQKGAHLE